MPDAKNEFTQVTRLVPEAIGEPGKRTFRIQVDSASSSARIWLEKEQLFQLALAIQQLMVTLTEETEAPGDPPNAEAPGLTNLEFKVGRLVLGHDSTNGLFIIDAHDVEEDENDRSPAMVRVWANRQQVNGFADEAFRACAAGRPLCPLCGRPMDPEGHKCVRVNGHGNVAEL